jgi:hypothetical protein
MTEDISDAEDISIEDIWKTLMTEDISDAEDISIEDIWKTFPLVVAI